MQNLGLSTSTPRTENRLKTLFWPSIQNQTDVDHLGRQGFWLCLIPAGENLLLAIVYRRYPAALAILTISFLFYTAAAIGIRERDRFAALAAFTVFLLGLINTTRISLMGAAHGVFGVGGVLNYFIAALLLANVRATWIAATALQGADFTSDRLHDTIVDKLSDEMPAHVWPALLIGWLIFSQTLKQR